MCVARAVIVISIEHTVCIHDNALHPPSLPVTSPHTKHPSLRSTHSHSSAAKALGSSADPYENDEIDSGSSDEETDSALGKAIVAEVSVVL